MGTNIGSIQSNMFAVGGRPLGLRFNEFSILQPQNTSFSINATIWDEALDQAAAASVLLDDWECEAPFNKGKFSVVQDIIDSFDSNMGTISCVGCPGGVGAD